MLASCGEEPVDHRIVVLCGVRFKVLPVDRYLDGVDMHVLQGGPHGWPRGPVAHGQILDTHNQKWGTVHEQSEASVLLDDARQRTDLGLGLEGCDNECGGKNGQRGAQHCGSDFHFLGTPASRRARRLSMPMQPSCRGPAEAKNQLT